MKKYLVRFGIVVTILLVIIAGLIWYADATNPFSSASIVKVPFTTYVDKSGIVHVQKQSEIHYIAAPQIISLMINQLGEAARIVPNRYHSEKPFIGNEEQIIAQIHQERFMTNTPYTISAGHFGELYVRNFGVFYASMLDGRFALSQQDWENRQRVTVQTLATDLELLRQAKKEYTTFFPVSPTGYMGINLYGYPSDSLLAIVWTLNSATNDKFLSSIFPANVSSLKLGTQPVANVLLQQYKTTLTQAVNQYLVTTIDPHTGLIRKDLPMSGARDELVRQSSFYDNVVAWETVKLAQNLGLQIQCPRDVSCDLQIWKQRIISAFWDDKEGIFLDDLSQESKQNHLYSADAFIITSTQFLDFSNEKERSMMEREIAFVQKNKFDQPYPLRYALYDQPNRMYFFQRYFAPSYMGKTIWSHWGIEYIKTLILLSQYNPQYVIGAQKGLDAYKNNIVKFGGFPELYDLQGNMYQTIFYKSLLHTGWVVNYEQAKMMYQSHSQK